MLRSIAKEMRSVEASIRASHVSKMALKKRQGEE